MLLSCQVLFNSTVCQLLGGGGGAQYIYILVKKTVERTLDVAYILLHSTVHCKFDGSQTDGSNTDCVKKRISQTKMDGRYVQTPRCIEILYAYICASPG